MAVVSSLLPSSTTITWSTTPCSMTSSYVLRSVFAALYAGMTTTTFFPLYIFLLHQDQFLYLRELSAGRARGRAYPVEVDARGKRRSAGVRALPLNRLISGGNRSVKQDRHGLPEGVRNGQIDRALLRQVERDPCRGVKWVGVVLAQRIFSRKIPDGFRRTDFARRRRGEFIGAQARDVGKHRPRSVRISGRPERDGAILADPHPVPLPRLDCRSRKVGAVVSENRLNGTRRVLDDAPDGDFLADSSHEVPGRSEANGQAVDRRPGDIDGLCTRELLPVPAPDCQAVREEVARPGHIVKCGACCRREEPGLCSVDSVERDGDQIPHIVEGERAHQQQRPEIIPYHIPSTARNPCPLAGTNIDVVEFQECAGRFRGPDAAAVRRLQESPRRADDPAGGRAEEAQTEERHAHVARLGDPTRPAVGRFLDDSDRGPIEPVPHITAW